MDCSPGSLLQGRMLRTTGAYYYVVRDDGKIENPRPLTHADASILARKLTEYDTFHCPPDAEWSFYEVATMCKENKTRTAQLEAALKTLHEGLTQLRLVKYSNSADSWDAVKAKTQRYFDALEKLGNSTQEV